MNFKYFRAAPPVGAYLIDKYNAEVQPNRECIIGSLLQESGALGVYQEREWGVPAVIKALVFPADHEITQVEGAKTHDHPSGVVVTFDPDAQFSVLYNDTISWLNRELLPYPGFSDWLHHHVGLTRFAISDDRQKLATYSIVLGDNSILFVVPEGHDGQSPIEPDKRLSEITPKEFEAIKEANV